jgi:hypothetical protein
MCRCEKNVVLPLRRVSKAFNTALRPYVLKTIQLEFSRFLKSGPELPDGAALERIGGFCQAVYLDMMVVRDEGMPLSLWSNETFEGSGTMTDDLQRK